MAKQEGLIKLTGRMKNVSFYKMESKYFAKTIGGADREKIHNSPKFKGTRDGMAEFGHAGSLAARIRKSLLNHLPFVKYNKLHNRLTTVLMTIVHTDTTHYRGERTISSGDISLLKGFDFNRFMNLRRTYFGRMESELNPTDREASIKLDFIPIQDLKAPSGATHVKYSMIILSIPDDKTFPVLVKVSDENLVPLNTTSSQQYYEVNFDEEAGQMVLQLIKIEFLQEMNGRYYEIKEKGGNVLTIMNAAFI